MRDHRSAAGRLGAYRSWAGTLDRPARTRPARAKSPASLEYHLDRLDPDTFAAASPSQREAAAEAARHAYYVDLAMRSAASRRARKAVTS